MGIVATFIIEIKAAQEKTEYTAENLRDPFWRQQDYAPEQAKEVVPLAKEPEKPLPALTVQGIIWDSKRPQAIINNKVLNLGDTISEARITDINKNGVTVSFYSREYNLSVAQASGTQEGQKNTAGGNL